MIAQPDKAAPDELGFVAGYQAGITTLRFHVDSLDLYYAWSPAINGLLQLDALGTINGAGDYRLVLTARDGGLPNGAGDRIRITIWNRATGALVYDSQPGATSGDAPTTPIALGDIVIRYLVPVFPQAAGSGPTGRRPVCGNANDAAARR